MKNNIKHVERFHDIMKIKNNHHPTLLETNDYILRHSLGLEELDEYKQACEDGDIVGICDALGDQLYILLGTILRHGVQDVIQDVFDEIQRSNMSKLGVDGKPIYREDGKVLKGPNYSRPDIKSILDKKNA